MSKPHSRASAKALELIETLQIDSPELIDVELIAAHHDIFVRYRPLTGQEGHLLRAKSRALIVVNEAAKHSDKWRFVIAHELGHFFLHPEHDQLPICTQQDLAAWYYTSGLEREANDFAAELLMPRHLFSPSCDQLGDEPMPSLKHISALAQRFGTSLTATALRFVQLTQHNVALVHATCGRIDWWSPSSSFGLKLKPHTMLGPNTYARALHQGQAIPNEPLPNEPCAWSRTLNSPSALLFEHSMMMREHQSTLTLLWHEDPDADA